MSLQTVHGAAQPGVQSVQRPQLLHARTRPRAPLQHVPRVLPRDSQALPVLLAQHLRASRLDQLVLRESGLQVSGQGRPRRLLLLALHHPQPEQAHRFLQGVPPRQAPAAAQVERAHLPGVSRRPVGTRSQDTHLPSHLDYQVNALTLSAIYFVASQRIEPKMFKIKN